jgi:plastocyanin
MVYPGTGMTRAKLAQLLWNAMNTYQSTTPVTPATPTQQQTQQTTQQTQESVVQPSNQPIWNTTDAMIINIETTGFVKNSMTIAQGAKVLWINKSSLPEDVTSNDGSFSSGTLQPGQSFMYTFNNLGTFNYYSSKNTSLTGTIIVKLPIEVPTI